jgi:preprotein translocase SecE subunit
MAVAVKNTPETSTGRPLNRLAVGSLVGTLYVFASLAILFEAVPAAWRLVVPGAEGAVGQTLLLLLDAAVAVGLVWLGRRLLGPQPAHGIRAGIFFGVLGVLVIALVTRGVGGSLESAAGGSVSTTGAAITSAIGLVLLVALAWSFFRPAFDAWLVTVEDQGWFSATAYKASQGVRVRRGTMVGILVLAGCGVYTLLARETLRTSASADWQVTIPFTDGHTVTLLPDVQFTLPLLLAAASLWLAYRVVNFPAFADFLIATEAELNKVSWTTRKRLVQDTIVVLTTLVLLTAFLFIVDVLWFKILSSPWIQVLQTSTTTTQEKSGAEEW